MNYRNEGLFSNLFLETRLRDMPEWRAQEIDTEKRERMRAKFEAALPGLPQANEAQTENDLIRPLLAALGHPFDVQTGIAAWAGRRVPDYAIFPSGRARFAALGVRGDTAFWTYASAVADAKAWNVSLDQLGAGGLGRNPAQQIAEYMRDTDQEWGVWS